MAFYRKSASTKRDLLRPSSTFIQKRKSWTTWIKGVSFYGNCGAASVGVLQDNLVLSNGVDKECELATVISLRWPIHIINPVDKIKFSLKTVLVRATLRRSKFSLSWPIGAVSCLSTIFFKHHSNFSRSSANFTFEWKHIFLLPRAAACSSNFSDLKVLFLDLSVPNKNSWLQVSFGWNTPRCFCFKSRFSGCWKVDMRGTGTTKSA